MMADCSQNENLQHALEALPPVVAVGDTELENNFIKLISIDTRTSGLLTVRRLTVHDAPILFSFYTEGLSEKSKHMFAPYPLFHSPPASASELAERITKWKNEKDWTAINLFKDKQIIGFCLLKRFGTEQATSSIVVRDDFFQKGLGCIMQTIIVEQARLLNLPGFHVKIVSDNLASIKLHERCGFRQTRILSPPLYEEILQYLSDQDKQEGKKAVNRHIIEMVMKFT